MDCVLGHQIELPRAREIFQETRNNIFDYNSAKEVGRGAGLGSKSRKSGISLLKYIKKHFENSILKSVRKIVEIYASYTLDVKVAHLHMRHGIRKRVARPNVPTSGLGKQKNRDKGF